MSTIIDKYSIQNSNLFNYIVEEFRNKILNLQLQNFVLQWFVKYQIVSSKCHIRRFLNGEDFIFNKRYNLL